MIISKLLKQIRLARIRRRTQSQISIRCVFNKNTILEGKNKIGNVNISDTLIGFGSYIIGGNAGNGIIGRFTSIGSNFKVIDADHPLNHVSTFPGFYKTKNTDIFIIGNNIPINERRLCKDGKSFNIGSDVWIGDNVSVRGGVTISDGAVIGANSFVTKDVPPYAVVGGIPARIIKFRFNEQVINSLLDIKWWDWTIDKIVRESKYFDNIEEFIKRNINKDK